MTYPHGTTNIILRGEYGKHPAVTGEAVRRLLAHEPRVIESIRISRGWLTVTVFEPPEADAGWASRLEDAYKALVDPTTKVPLVDDAPRG